MAATISTRSSVLAIKKETTEGTPEVPTSGADAVALQDDFSMTPQQDLLENAELKDSIGSAAPATGLENPPASMSHYWRASGTENTPANYSELIEACLGQETISSAERDTIAGSTVSAINVDTGEGAEFPKGRVMLVKDSTNGFNVRFSDGATADVITPSFDLPNAPGAGVNLGNPVWYSPLSSGHPTLSLWHYLGNKGALQLSTGQRVTDMTITHTAGEFINANYTMQGTRFFFDPIEITASTNTLDFTDDDGTFAAAVTAQYYTSPLELADALASAMNATATTETHTVTWSKADGKFTITNTTGSTLSLLWASGTNTASTIGGKLGFDTGSDDTAATTYQADNAQDWSFQYTASFDSQDPLVAKNNEFLLGRSASDTACFAASEVVVSVSNTIKDILSVCEVSGKEASIFSAREVTWSVTARLEQHQVDEFHAFQKNQDVKAQYTAGRKSGSNWTPGTVMALYSPTTKIESIDIADDDGVAILNLSLRAFVPADGSGEIFVGQA